MENPKKTFGYFLDFNANLSNKQITLVGLAQSTFTVIYVALIALILFNFEKILGENNDLFGIIVFLLLFVISASTTGFLVLGYPSILLFQHRFREAMLLIATTIGYMGLFTIILGTTLSLY